MRQVRAFVDCLGQSASRRLFLNPATGIFVPFEVVYSITMKRQSAHNEAKHPHRRRALKQRPAFSLQRLDVNQRR